MPISRSHKPGAKQPSPAARARFPWPLIVIGILVVSLVVVIALLPASIVAGFLPPSVAAADFSGTVWHGSAGKVTVNRRDAGALEWHLHPASLLLLAVSAQAHWVKTGFVADGNVEVNRLGFTARDIEGGGPLEDLRTFGFPAAWRGASNFKFREIKAAFTRVPPDDGGITLLSAVGEVRVSKLASSQIANGADLGGYVLRLANGAITPDSDATATLNDTGGPLEVAATIHFSASARGGLLAGTIKERADAPPSLRTQLNTLTQMHARDSQGRIPIDLEFSL